MGGVPGGTPPDAAELLGDPPLVGLEEAVRPAVGRRLARQNRRVVDGQVAGALRLVLDLLDGRLHGGALLPHARQAGQPVGAAGGPCLVLRVVVVVLLLLLLTPLPPAPWQLVDCAGGFNNFGCNGGLPSQAFEYLKWQGGQDSETAYPYTAVTGPSCKYDGKPSASVSKVVNITALGEEELVDAVGSTGPVSIAFQVSDGVRC